MRAAAFICPNISSLRATGARAQQLDQDLLGFRRVSGNNADMAALLLPPRPILDRLRDMRRLDAVAAPYLRPKVHTKLEGIKLRISCPISTG